MSNKLFFKTVQKEKTNKNYLAKLTKKCLSLGIMLKCKKSENI